MEKNAIEFTAYKDAKGFERSLTLRGDSGTEVIEKMNKAIDAILEKGGTPIAKSFGNKPQYPTKPSGGMCKIHSVEMKLNKNGNPYHSQGVYPNLIYCNGKGFPDDIGKMVDDSFRIEDKGGY